MTLTFLPEPVTKALFDINAAREDGRPVALLPQPEPELRSQVRDVVTYLHAMHATAGEMMKATQASELAMLKALNMSAPPQAYSFATMSFMPDPANAGLLPWPGLPPESLRKVARENSVVQLVNRARVNDFARYSGLSTQLWEPGWNVGMRDASDRPTTQDKADIRDAQRFVWNCNRESSYGDARERDAKNISNFEDFMRKCADDTHTYDGWAIWTDMDRAGRIKSFAPLPAGNIRLAVPGRGYQGDPRLFAALVDDTGNPVVPFTRDQLTWAIRNPRTDPSAWGYGWSEIEISILMVQAFQNAIQLNTDTFSRNSIPNGMLIFEGDFFNQSQIDAIMREWTNMKRGISKSWGFPVMSVPKDSKVDLLQFMDMKGEDIRYKDHLNLMGGIYCVIAQFPPRRLGIFASGNRRDNSPAQNESVEIAGVDDPGLPGELLFISNRINEYLIWPQWPRLKLTFYGANPKQDAREYEARKQARTWGETRKSLDLPPLSQGAKAEDKPMLDLMEHCPEDPAKVTMFQAIVIKHLELKAAPEGGDGTGKDPDASGAPFPSKTDPAKSQDHGHRAGVRRDGARERASAEAGA